MKILYLGTCALLASSLTYANDPDWWSERQVTNALQPNDYAAANVGQAKHILTNAIAELNEKFSPNGGATFSLSSFIDTEAEANDYAVLNRGQIKFIAKRLYDRLNELQWFTGSYYYPWTQTTTDDNDYAAVNIGQLKNIFNLDFEEKAADTDSDGLYDFWEMNTVGNLTTLQSANHDNDSDGVSNIEEYNLRTQPTTANNSASTSQISLTVISTFE